MYACMRTHRHHSPLLNVDRLFAFIPRTLFIVRSNKRKTRTLAEGYMSARVGEESGEYNAAPAHGKINHNYISITAIKKFSYLLACVLDSFGSGSIVCSDNCTQLIFIIARVREYL